MKNYLQIINSLVDELKALPTISEEDQRKLEKKFRLEFNYNSNHIEGNTLTYGETELLLIFDKTEGVHEMREYEEMKAHDVAFKLIQEWASDKDFRLAEIHIKQLNEIILVRPFWKEAQTQDGQNTRRLIKIGNYKELPNSVRLQNGEIFHYASPLETPMKMGDLIQWYTNEIEKNELSAVELAALFHYKFVLIHPFDDGNGRISRLLMNYILLKNNLPPIIIKTTAKKDYLNALNQADIGNLDAFVEYIATQLIWSLEITKKGIIGESLDEVGDLEKKLFILKKKLGVENIVSKYYSHDIVIEIIENVYRPLFIKLEEIIESVNPFFNNRTSEIIHSVEDIYPSYETYKIQSKNDIFPKSFLETLLIQELNSFSYHISFNGLRNRTNNNNYEFDKIEFVLNKNSYSIISDSTKIQFNKLYSEILTEEKINNFAERIGTSFYNKIELELEK